MSSQNLTQDTVSNSSTVDNTSVQEKFPISQNQIKSSVSDSNTNTDSTRDHSEVRKSVNLVKKHLKDRNPNINLTSEVQGSVTVDPESSEGYSFNDYKNYIP